MVGTLVWTRRLLVVMIGVALLATACSGDDDETDAGATDSSEASTSETSEETTTTVADETTTTAEETTSSEASTTEAETEDTTDDDDGGDAAGAAVTVELGEWFVDMPTTLDAGTISFDISNVDPERPHAFAVVKGERYEDLPQLDNGAVDTDEMGDDFLGTTENIEANATGEISFDLEAGNYVFFCPINFGPNSHARAGQVLSVTVG